MARHLFVMAALLGLLPSSLFGQEAAREPLLVVYGPKANSSEGDPDRIERLFFSLPAGTTGPLHLRLLDAEIGGSGDTVVGQPDGVTDFRLYGGEGAYTAAARPMREADGVRPDPRGAEQPAPTGLLLAERSVGAEADLDDQWTTFHSFDPSEGEVVGDRLWFRLDVQGVAGNDGNVFAATISTEAGGNTAPDGMQSVSFAPTLRWPGEGEATEVRVAIPEGGQISLQNFDAAAGQLQLVTLYEDFPVAASGQDIWIVQDLTVPDPEAAISLLKGSEKPNDATLSVFSPDGAALPLIMPPVRAIPFNRPDVVATAEPLSNCTSVAFDASASLGVGELSYLWDFGDGVTSDLPVIAREYAAPGRYEAVLLILDPNAGPAAGARLRLPVHVRPAPVAMAGDPVVVAPGETVDFTGAASVASDSPITGYAWTFGDGAAAGGMDASHVYTASGSYRAVLRVEDASQHPCNFGLATRVVTVNHAPVAEAGTDQVNVVGGKVRFTGAASYDVDGAVVSYRWDMGDGTFADGPAVEHAYQAPGTYAVTLTVTDDSGVSNNVALDTTTVVVNAPPQAVGKGPDRPIAVGEVTTLSSAGSMDPDGEILDYLWDFGDGAAAGGPEVQYAWTTPGIFDVKLTVTDNSGTATGTVETGFQVVVSAAPVANAGPDQDVTASVVSFDGGASSDADGRVTRWDWDFGDGSTGSGQTVQHPYAAAGSYEVTLTVIDDSGAPLNVAQDTMTVTINATPVADAGPDLVTAPGQPVVLDASASIDPDGVVAGWTWTFPDGSTQQGALVEQTFDTPGRYAVALTAADDFRGGAAVDHDEVIVTVNAPPFAVIGPDLLVEPGVPVNFSGLNSYDPDGFIAEYRWDFEDLDEPIRSEAVSHVFATPGVVGVQLTVVDASGALNATAQAGITVRINHAPVAEAGPEIATSALFVDLDASGSSDGDGDNLTYTWDFGDGSAPQQGQKLRHAFPRSGSYPVTLVVDDGTGLGNARATDATVVVIDAAPVAVAGGNRDVCSGFPILFDASASADPDGGRLLYEWDFGDGTTSEIVNPNKTYEVPGAYPVTLTVRDESGAASGVATDRIAALVREGPISNAGADLQACTAQEVRFDGTGSTDTDGAVNAYAWAFGDGITGSGDRPAHIFSEPGKYTVNLTITGDSNGLCSPLDSDQMEVEIFAAPSLLILAEDRMSAGVAGTFVASISDGADAAGAVIAWDFGDGTKAEGLTGEHAFAQSGTYIVTATTRFPNAVAACQDITVQHKVIVNAAPTAVIAAPEVLAAGEAAAFDATGSTDADGALTGFAWDFGDGNTAVGVRALHTYAEAGSYTVTLRVTDNAGTANSEAIATWAVTVNPAPDAGLATPGALCVGAETAWSATAGPGVTAEWSFGDGTQLSGAEVRHAFDAPGLYPVAVTLDDGRDLPNSRRVQEVYARVNAPPVAFAGPDRTVCPGEAVVFDAGASADIDGAIGDYLWTFADGVVLTGPVVERAFDTAGPVEVTLTVTDTSGAVGCNAGLDTATIKVNAAPVVDAGADRSTLVGAAHDTVTFADPQAVDPDGDGLILTWDFGDGARAVGAQVAHAYANAGDYTVTVTAEDASGLTCGRTIDTARITAILRE